MKPIYIGEPPHRSPWLEVVVLALPVVVLAVLLLIRHGGL